MAYTTINKSSDYFNTKLYTGNGGTQAVTGIGFQPDWVWVKNRDVGTDAPTIYDAVRGATKRLQTSSTGAESTKTNGLTAFNSNGYTAGSASAINANGSNIVSWNWKANGQGSSNTDGSINTTYTSANTTAGFSISTYTGNGSAGATVGHGLGAVPKMIIIKQYSSNGGTENWAVYHNKLGNTDALYLSASNSTVGSNLFWNNTTPSSTLITLGSGDHVNNNTVSYIAYCFAEKTGYSKFGSYTGNGNADGAFVYTGFKPAWVLVKCSSAQADWELSDNKRTTSGGNVIDKEVRPNSTAAETGGTDGRYIDYVSNGFKLRQGFGNWNDNGATYIYMAFAEAPLVGSNGVTAKAR